MKTQILFSQLTCAGFLMFASLGQAQPSAVPAEHFWNVNGPVYAITVVSNTAFIGGAFTYVGPRAGNLVLAERLTAQPRALLRELKGQVNCVIADGQGGWFAGGTFDFGSKGLRNLIHIWPDGVVDEQWAPDPDGAVNALVLAPGHLFVAGDFTRMAGAARSYLVSLNPQTGRTNNWNVRLQGAVNAMILADTTLYFGGSFTSVNGKSRSRLAALTATNAELSSWSPGVSGGGGVKALAFDEGVIYVGGEFTTCGGKPRNRLAAVDAASGGATSWNPDANGAVNALLPVSGKLYVGGAFTAVGGRNRKNLAVVDAVTGQAEESWSPEPNGAVESLTVRATELFVGGAFSSISANDRDGIAVFGLADGALTGWRMRASTLQPGVATAVRAIGVQDDVVAVGGKFSSAGGVERLRVAAIDLTTGEATAWRADADNEVYALTVAGDRLYVGGLFGSLAGAAVPRLGAVRRATGEAINWNPQCSTSANHCILAIAVPDTSRVIVGGRFTSMGGEARNHFADLSSADAAVSAWNPSPQAIVRALCVENGLLYVAGEFTAIAGTNRSYLAAFKMVDGKLAGQFDAKANGIVRALVCREGVLYAGGDFTQMADQQRSRLAGIDAETGGETQLWNANVGVSGQLRVHSLAVAGRTIYVGGAFSSAGGEFRKNAVALRASNASANAWDASLNQTVRALALAEEYLLVGGEFTSSGPAGIPYFAAFSGKPAFVNAAIALNAAKEVELQICDGDGRGSSVELQAAANLNGGEWQTIDTAELSGAPVTLRDTGASGSPSRFYRLVRKP